MKLKQYTSKLKKLNDRLRSAKVAQVMSVIQQALSDGVPVVLLAGSKDEYEQYAWDYWKQLGYPQGSSTLTFVDMNRPECGGNDKLRVDYRDAIGLH